MIKQFLHRGLQRFFETGSKAGIVPHHAERLARQLIRLDDAKRVDDMNVAGWGLHPLQGKPHGRYAITVNGNWRMVFKLEGENAVLVDYLDYH